MLKKSKSDTPKEPKQPKQPKPPKPDKADKPKGEPYKPFWVVWKEKRQNPSGRPKSIAQTPTSREDKLKLMGCAAILVGIVVVLFIMQMIGSHQAPVAPK